MGTPFARLNRFNSDLTIQTPVAEQPEAPPEPDKAPGGPSGRKGPVPAGSTIAMRAYGNLPAGKPTPFLKKTATEPVMGCASKIDDIAARIAPRPPAGISAQTATHSANRNADRWDLADLAAQPERITEMLRTDGQFRSAYKSLFAQSINLGNGTITVPDTRQLKRENQGALRALVENETRWRENSAYSDVLSALPNIDNPTVELHTSGTENAFSQILDEMRANPETPVCWSINGNNHFPTHQKLRGLIQSLADERQKLNAAHGLATKDILIVSGNAAQKTAYGPGPLGKFTGTDNRMVGKLSEAQAISSMLFPDPALEKSFEVILETEARNTRENLTFTNLQLGKRFQSGDSVIRVNTQSGFSGLRSALTSIGWQNGDTLPEKMHFLNPDLSVEEGIDMPSYEFAGKTFLQVMREFMNITADISRSLFVPQVKIPAEIIADFKVCLLKLGIDPDQTPAPLVQDALREMHAVAMQADHTRLIADDQSYAGAAEQFANAGRDLRVRQNAIKNIIGPIRKAFDDA